VTARQIRAQVVDILAYAALPVAVFLVAVALSTQLDGWLAVPVAVCGGAAAVGIAVARVRWHRRGGA
jgi:hypothetical protein